MSTAYINIGSNMGNRNALIEQAIAHIEFLCNAKTRKSPYVESEPWGYDSPNTFLNIGIAIETQLNPQE